jgi:methyltransferase
MMHRSQAWYLLLLAGFALLRLVELYFSRRHQTRLLADGGSKVHEPLYPLMVVTHVSVFVGSATEVWFAQRPFTPALGWSMVIVLGVCLAGRVWVWWSLKEQWNVHIVISSYPVVDSGPYRYVRHPNYTIVIAEMVALPLVHSAYLTALVCSGLNAGVLWYRIRREEAALWKRPDYVVKMGPKPRFLPSLVKGR